MQPKPFTRGRLRGGRGNLSVWGSQSGLAVEDVTGGFAESNPGREGAPSLLRGSRYENHSWSGWAGVPAAFSCPESLARASGGWSRSVTWLRLQRRGCCSFSAPPSPSGTPAAKPLQTSGTQCPCCSDKHRSSLTLPPCCLPKGGRGLTVTDVCWRHSFIIALLSFHRLSQNAFSNPSSERLVWLGKQLDVPPLQPDRLAGTVAPLQRPVLWPVWASLILSGKGSDGGAYTPQGCRGVKCI